MPGFASFILNRWRANKSQIGSQSLIIVKFRPRAVVVAQRLSTCLLIVVSLNLARQWVFFLSSFYCLPISKKLSPGRHRHHEEGLQDLLKVPVTLQWVAGNAGQWGVRIVAVQRWDWSGQLVSVKQVSFQGPGLDEDGGKVVAVNISN